LVAEHYLDWLRVWLPLRPNGSTGWVQPSDVTVASDPYQITVQRAQHRLVVTDGPTLLLEAPVGVGAPVTPTPAGFYFITELVKTPDPGGPYGPYAYGLSGHSSTLDDFAGGDGTIGIHGTNQPDSIGYNVSHGCIRLANGDVEKLVAVLPLGTPVVIL
jgi:lipoprotein-anchoring transpeptidase ErfK/SrfK